MSKPIYEDDNRAFKICCAGKQGRYIAPSDIKWLKQFYDKYPKWAGENKDRLFEATKPYGAR